MATRMQRKKNAVLSRDFESKVVGSKRAPAMNLRPRLHRSGDGSGVGDTYRKTVCDFSVATEPQEGNFRFFNQRSRNLTKSRPK